MLPLADLAAALRMRWRLELLVFVLVLGAILLWTAVSPRIYVASSTILFDEPSVDPVQGTQTGQDNLVALLATQADVINSDAVAGEVVRSLNLVTPAVLARWQAATNAAGDVNMWYGHQLLGNLTVAPEKGSRVLAIHYTSPDPQFAALMSNGFASSYIDTRLKMHTDPARTYSRWFQDRTREVRGNLEQAQAKLTAFKRRTGIVDSGAADAEASRLGELSSQLTSAEASAADLRARSGGNASQSPDVQSSAVVQGLRSQIAVKSAQVSQMSTSLGPNHPDRVAAEAELAALRSKLAGEIGSTTRSIQVASGAASSKEAQLRQKLNVQRGRMLGLAGDRAELDVLQRDVDSARAAYDAVTARLETMRLQSVAPETNVRQLDSATAPVFPAKPNVPLRFLLGSLLGVLLAIGAALAMEIWRPRVRTAQGTTNITGVPVLAAINLSRSRAGALLGGTAQ